MILVGVGRTGNIGNYAEIIIGIPINTCQFERSDKEYYAY